MAVSLPDLPNLLRISKAMAMLDAILCPDWQYRFYSFNSKWAAGEQMASMRDGCGDSYFVLFNSYGAMLKGYVHESEAAKLAVEQGNPPPGMFDGVPDEFAGFVKEPAFSIDDTTFTFWRTNSDSEWRTGQVHYPKTTDPSGAYQLLTVFDGDPEFYVQWATDYYEQKVDTSAVRNVYSHEPLTAELVNYLNPNLTIKELTGDIEEIAYPTK